MLCCATTLGAINEILSSPVLPGAINKLVSAPVWLPRRAALALHCRAQDALQAGISLCPLRLTGLALRPWPCCLITAQFMRFCCREHWAWGCLQMAGLTFLLYGFKAGPSDLATRACEFGVPLLAVAALITAFSLGDYFRKLWSVL